MEVEPEGDNKSCTGSELACANHVGESAGSIGTRFELGRRLYDALVLHLERRQLARPARLIGL